EMSFRLVYTQRAIKDIQKLEPTVKSRIGKALLRFEADPLSYAKSLSNTSLGSYRFRIGDYRVIFDLEGEEIIVLRVGHRRDIYKG
ncbi:MAG: type II toxin-antitoxin system RelE/ParE family toxin, partial [Candidatus Omnitrophota bacterium]